LSCLIVDEVSTIDAKIIAILHFRLQQIVDNTLPSTSLVPSRKHFFQQT